MKPEKKIKEQMIAEASAHPEKYFPVETLQSLGFQRQTCSSCHTKFWSTTTRDVCGDTNCIGGYFFIEDSPAKTPMEFPEVYLRFQEFMQKRGYTAVERFPIVARWRDDLDFNIASVIGFQPYVTKGLVKPPAETVTIPQNCLRFADIDNIGYTGRHFSGFTMIGQLAFKEPQQYDQATYVKDLLDWFIHEMQIPREELQIHEDAWLGGGDCGPSMEFFSRGLELGNQVYMWFDMSEAEDISEIKELDVKVLDMGMGQERCCWFSKGSLNAFEACMPRICAYLYEKTGFQPDWELYRRFLPYSGLLNLDEVEDIDEVWEDIAKKMEVSTKQLKDTIEPIAGIYSIADHSRTLLYALHDGALPSNVKGGYNLRLVLRRALDFITTYGWDIDLFDVIAMQAEELSELYPELRNHLDGIKKIIDHEVEKYYQHKEKVKNKIQQITKKNQQLSDEDFITYYISEGITPQEIKKGFEENGSSITIPANFFTQVTEFFEERRQSEKQKETSEIKTYVEDIPPTTLQYYEDDTLAAEEAEILKEFTFQNKTYVVLDKTIFYPTGGGQAHDTGHIGSYEVVDVIKVDGVVLHQVKKTSS